MTVATGKIGLWWIIPVVALALVGWRLWENNRASQPPAPTKPTTVGLGEPCKTLDDCDNEATTCLPIEGHSVCSKPCTNECPSQHICMPLELRVITDKGEESRGGHYCVPRNVAKTVADEILKKAPRKNLGDDLGL